MNVLTSPAVLPEAPAPRPARRWLGAALAATLAATAWSAWTDDTGAVVAPTKRSRVALRLAGAGIVHPSMTDAPWPEPIAPRPLPATSIDAAAWSAPAAPNETPPAPPRPLAVPPSAPERVAPVFAYTLIGRLDDGRQRALLTGPRRSLAVQAGDIVDDEWRVDAVRPDGVSLTWLPGNSQQLIGFKAS